MIKVGLTGGIGSGKTIVSKVFTILGIPVYNSDINAKHLMVKNEVLNDKLRQEFGNEIFNKKGRLKNKKLAEIVFKDKSKLHTLNTLVHPFVRKDFKFWMTKQKGSPYVIEESAILIETGYYKDFDKMILVTAPLELRIERIMKRDKVNKSTILKRMYNQLAHDIKESFVDFIIVNDYNSLIIPQYDLLKKFPARTFKCENKKLIEISES